jgi:hypothetical protein
MHEHVYEVVTSFVVRVIKRGRSRVSKEQAECEDEKAGGR